MLGADRPSGLHHLLIPQTSTGHVHHHSTTKAIHLPPLPSLHHLPLPPLNPRRAHPHKPTLTLFSILLPHVCFTLTLNLPPFLSFPFFSSSFPPPPPKEKVPILTFQTKNKHIYIYVYIVTSTAAPFVTPSSHPSPFSHLYPQFSLRPDERRRRRRRYR